MGKAAGFIKLLRPINGLMMGVAVLVGASLALMRPFSIDVAVSLLLGFITAFTLTGASMAINDYYDYEIDKINEPNRPIPSGAVKRGECMVFALILIITGLAASILIAPFSLMPFLVAVVSLFTSLLYATKGKKTGLTGNFLVSACVAIPFVYGSFVVGQSLSLRVLFFSVLAFLANTGREVTKGIVDFEGDKIKGIKTIMAVYGSKKASIVAAFFFLSAVILSLLPWFLGIVSTWYLPPVIVTDLGFTISSTMLVKDHSKEKARQIKNLVLVWMLLGMISFFTGTL
ncbi:UbiA family prenyltransferase [Candidatus Bathyarchaeota archaeon]|nr:UbiA family prenyltransferase [Candidatus Bathyarchaeota archaeon]